jgi:hypothetical protein
MRLCCKILSDNISFKPVEVSAGFFGYNSRIIMFCVTWFKPYKDIVFKGWTLRIDGDYKIFFTLISYHITFVKS